MSDVQIPAAETVQAQAPAPAQAVTPTTTEAAQAAAVKSRKMIEIPAAEVLANAGNKTVAVPTSVFKELKQQARQRGAEEGAAKALAEVAPVAKAFGFDDPTAFLKAVKKGEVKLGSNTQATQEAPSSQSSAAGEAVPEKEATQTTTTAPKAAQQRETKTMSDNKLADIEKKWAADMAELKGKVQTLEATNRAAQDALAAKDAEMQLRERFIRSGVRDADYLTTLMAREVNSMDDAALKAFDENAWLDKQKTDRPYLFETATPPKPATTGAAAGEATAPTPGQVAAATAGAGAFNGRQAKPEEFRARLAALGLGVPGR